MYDTLLLELGFTKSEISVYFALLKLGSSTTGPIIREAGIASGKAYLVLDKLIEKGLVTYSLQSKVKHYQACNPERIISYIENKERALAQKKKKFEDGLPKIKAEYEERNYRPMAEVYEGIKGFKTFYEWTLEELKKGDSIYLLGVPSEANDKFEGYFLDWNKRRIAQGVKMKILYNHDNRSYGKRRSSMPLTQVRYMSPELETPAWIVVFKDYVVTINVHSTPVCFLINDIQSSKSYKKYFDVLWVQGKT